MIEKLNINYSLIAFICLIICCDVTISQIYCSSLNLADRYYAQTENENKNIPTLILPEKVYVEVNNLTVYSEPNLRSKVVTKIYKGTPLKVLGEDGLFWYYVEADEISGLKLKGWVAQRSVTDDSSFYKYYQIHKKEVNDLEIKVRKIPVSNYSAKLKIYKQLLKMEPGNQKYQNKVEYYNNKKKVSEKKWQQAKDKKMALKGYQLQIMDWSWKISSGYAIGKGLVRNITQHKLKNIIAIVTWYDKNGSMITYDTSLIEYTTLMPGQTSPFTVMEDFNPLMTKAIVGFKTFHGKPVMAYEE